MASNYYTTCATVSGTTGTSISGSTFTNCTFVSSSSTGSSTGWTDSDDLVVKLEDSRLVNGKVLIKKGDSVKLPDGTVIEVDDNGNFVINDKDAKVTYKANRNREFNRFINASDLLEAFICDLGDAGVRQGDVLSIPVEVFINWLIYKSAEQDGDEIPDDLPRLEDLRKKKPRCLCCGRFIKKDLADLKFCNGEHYDKYTKKMQLKQMP